MEYPGFIIFLNFTTYSFNLCNMRKTSILLTIIILTIPCILQAAKVSRQDALQVARNFYWERASQYKDMAWSSVRVAEVFDESREGIILYYGVSMMPDGFVIVSANDAVMPVLGYSFEGSYSPGQKPAGFEAWMGQYQKAIMEAIEMQLTATESTQKEWKRLLSPEPSALKPLKGGKSVQPLLISNWDQGKYYNTQCPADPLGPDGHAVTGCVATAMGQIMYYYRWPEQGTGSYTYLDSTYGTLSANFGNTTYDWNNMKNTLQSYNNGVAKLISHAGISVDMAYGPYGSGMWNHKAAYSLRTYFKYLPTCQYVWRDTTNLDWDSLIVAQLDRGQVLYYAGWSDYQYISGHAFVCDGYQTPDYCHFNWGWSGQFNGYFYLNALNPGGSNFNLVQELIINIYPDTTQYTWPNYCQGNQVVHFQQGTLEDGSGPILPYGHDANCSWLLDPQTAPQDSVSSITLTFNKFNTESGQDFLNIYDGPTTASPLLGSYSGASLPPTLTSTSNKVLITFTSNSLVEAPGWFLTYNSNLPDYCDNHTITAPTGTISDGSGIKNYTNNTLCSWTLDPPFSTGLTLTFTSFNTEPLVDFVEVYDLNTQELLGTYWGNQLPPVLTANSGAMYLVFKTNGSVTDQGWTADYTVTNLGLNENPVQALTVFPNPTYGPVTVNFGSNAAEAIQWEIINVLGQELCKGNLEGNKDKVMTLTDLGAFPSGTYWIRFTDSKGVSVKKVVLR